MNDWLPKQHKWITAGYTEYRKRRKKKHSKELFEKHVKQSFLDQKIDVDQVWSAPKLFMELFWQVECLKEWIFDINKTLIIQGLEKIHNRMKRIEMVQELKNLAERAQQIYKG